MKSGEIVKTLMKRRRKRDGLKLRLGLQARMTMSYVGVSVVTALLLELLLGVIFFVVVSRFAGSFQTGGNQNSSNSIAQTAQVYALEAAVQGGGSALDPRSTFQPGQPSSIVLPGANSSESVPYIGPGSRAPQTVEFALLIAPNGQVLASSYPARYPASKPVAQLLPDQKQLILNALAGRAGDRLEVTSQGNVASAVQPVWSREGKPIGAVYVQSPPVAISGFIPNFALFWLITGLFWLIITAPVGAIFGVLTTRGLIRRLHRLVNATADFANGDYTQRVRVTKRDEIGQLESQFNSMAQQLVESIAQQQALVEQQARLEERARIDQELRAAQYIQRALLPKDVPALPGWQLAPLYRPAKEVGGDFYDFHPLEDGRLGLVIGDATGKGMPAALVMATTCTMLRTATQGTTSPGGVLARVNDLLYTTIPEGMFATCFYGILDPSNGRLCYANAGHDWPYRRYCNGVSELQAAGLPLGIMPGSRYDEQEVTLAPGESLIFFSDGLVEAHNAQRDMFGLPHLKALIASHAGGTGLIDFLLSELATFTGNGWEQEDDVTMVALHRTSSEEVQ